ncbi:MAG TPA: 5-oxoprolinase subunit PxpA [Pyrinomonadaceae bacterium]|nr:5-oxoprolinase subunit PxpA [Pyrinomonadaceae bacterium]HMP66840.1 5-oxoprolinase subunit PxpA [Pyrinomonadaceae bacterium]
MRHSIDINCDLGEGSPNDADLMRLISSANVACGAHAGDAETMERTVALAIENNVAVGAHPGYPDLVNFGRAAMDLASEEIVDIVTGQIYAMSTICVRLGARLRHVKPHGALYNRSAKDAQTAAAVAKAVFQFDRNLILFGLSGSLSIAEAERVGLRTASEVFADRTYLSDGSLTPRSRADALIADPGSASRQAIQMVFERRVTATDGTPVPICAETICVHGDGDNAVALANSIRRSLLAEGIEIRCFDDE